MDEPDVVVDEIKFSVEGVSRQDLSPDDLTTRTSETPPSRPSESCIAKDTVVPAASVFRQTKLSPTGAFKTMELPEGMKP